MTDNHPPNNEWPIAPRKLPLPAGASQALQNAISNTPAPDVTEWEESFPKTDAEWLAFIEERNQERLDQVQELLANSPVSVEADRIAGVNVYHVIPTEIDPRHEDHLFVYVHGGAYILLGGEAGLREAILIALRANMRVIAIDYRMPPDHPFPVGLQDVVAVYENLLSQRTAGTIALGGTSAGGGLTLSAIHKMKQLGMVLPGALFAGTPWSDLTKTGDSYWINEGVDRVLVGYRGILDTPANMYAAGHDLRDPLLSPIYGNFENFPPTFLVTGTRDLFLSNTVRVHTKLRAANVTADQIVFEGVAHSDYGSEIDSPESWQTYVELKKFLLQHLP